LYSEIDFGNVNWIVLVWDIVE